MEEDVGKKKLGRPPVSPTGETMTAAQRNKLYRQKHQLKSLSLLPVEVDLILKALNGMDLQQDRLDVYDRLKNKLVSKKGT